MRIIRPTRPSHGFFSRHEAIDDVATDLSKIFIYAYKARHKYVELAIEPRVRLFGVLMIRGHDVRNALGCHVIMGHVELVDSVRVPCDVSSNSQTAAILDIVVVQFDNAKQQMMLNHNFDEQLYSLVVDAVARDVAHPTGPMSYRLERDLKIIIKRHKLLARVFPM